MSNPHVLVVDDEADIRALISGHSVGRGLRRHRSRPTPPRRARAAERRFDLVLLDIWMPDTDGITLLREWSEAAT